MAEPDNIVAKASQDLQTIEDFVNLPAGSVVNPRLLPYVNVGTLADIRDAIFKAGGLPAEPFATKALMESSDLIDGDYAIVTNDAANNGLYVKTAGEWVKSDYDIRGITREEISKVAEKRDTKPYFDFASDNGVTLMQIDANKHLNLHGMDKSIQDTLDDINKPNTTNGEPHFVFVDDNDNELLSIYGDGGLKPANMSTTIQERLEAISQNPTNNTPLRTNTKLNTHNPLTYTVNPACKNRLINAQFYNTNNSPLPLYMLPQQSTIGTEWVSTVKTVNGVGNLSDKRQIDGYAPEYTTDIGVVHPQLWEFSEKVAGYRYWLGINPYTSGNEDIELAYIYGTNNPDLDDWTLIPNFPTPFEADPIDEAGSYRGFMSDSGFTYDIDTGDLIFFWRKYLYFEDGSGVKTEQVGIRARRFDGKAWSEIFDLVPLELVNSNGSAYRSMSIIHNPIDDLYYCYVSVGNGQLWYHTTPRLDGRPWSYAQKCTITGDTRNFWHTEVKSVGDKLVFLGSSTDSDIGLRVGYSSDYTTFNIPLNPLYDNVLPIYKGSFLPYVGDDMQGHLKIAYTLPSGSRGLYITKTTNINFGV